MRPEMLDRLRSVARGTAGPKTTVTANPHVTDTPGYTQKIVKLQRLHLLHVKNSDLGKDVPQTRFEASDEVSSIDDGWTDEREAIAIGSGRVPDRYASAFAGMQARQPEGMSSADWFQALNDAGLFLDTWGRQAAEFGWQTADLFEWVPAGCRGLVWELRGRLVVALTDRSAAIEGHDGALFALFARPTEMSERRI